jgi:TM2 domain-containing membrane protein YozV
MYPNGKPMLDAEGRPASPKSRLAAALLAWFLGVFGIHRFYVGKVGTGILMILTLGGLGIWVLIDLIVILIGSFKDKQERYLANW